MDKFHIKTDLLQSIEHQIKHIHSQIIKGIAQDIFQDKKVTPEMLKKYIKTHPKTNDAIYLRRPRPNIKPKHNNDLNTCDTSHNNSHTNPCNNSQTNSHTKLVLSHDLNTTVSYTDDEEDDEDRCVYLINKRGKTKRCRHKVVEDSSFCGIHQDIEFCPFGIVSD